MKNLFLFFPFVLLASASQAGIKASELNGFDVMSLNGTYKTAGGDKIEVVVSPVKKNQGELFGPSEYSVVATLSLEGLSTNFNTYEVISDEWNTTVDPKKSQLSMTTKVECEDPGCEWHEITLVFMKTKNGTFEVAYDFTFGAEVNEAFYEQDVPSKKELTTFCSETYGPLSEGSKSNGSLYCDAFISGTMK